MDQQKLKKYLIILVILVAIGIAVKYVMGNGSDSSTVSVESQSVNTADQTDVNSLLQKTKISLDTTFFNDPNFKKLVDHTVVFTPQPAGRPNPFAPLGSDSLVNVSTTSKKK